MPVTKLGSTASKSMTAAIIVAGGRGQRMAHAQPKQFMPLGSRPILAHSLITFDDCRTIDAIYLVIPVDHWERCRSEVLNPLAIQTPLHLVPGGRERQESVHNGLTAMAPSPPDWVVVHDGVRPFITDAQIKACLKKAQEKGAAILGTPVADTLKRTSPVGLITETIPRQSVWRAQTPQVFPFDWLWAAHERAVEERFIGTDDAQLVEWTGRPVAVVPGNAENLKITTPEDLRRAEAILKLRESRS